MIEQNPNEQIEDIGKQAATLSLIEIGLGSLLHSFKIPLAGHLLSINQIALMARSSFKLNSKSAALRISLIASLLKSLSPAGKKLTPMLAIAAQGLFFHLGINFSIGVNYIGLFFAVILSSSWAFIQPVFFILLLFGKTSIEVAQYFLNEFTKFIPHLDQILVWGMIGLVIIKWIASYCIAVMAIRMSDVQFDRYQKKIILQTKPRLQKTGPVALLALRDLFNPLFIISFGMTLVFFIFSHSSLAQMIWGLLRPLALGYIFFYIIRIYPVENFSLIIKKRGFTQMSRALDTAIKFVRER